MLVVVQFPIADIRPFIPELGGRLPAPSWPPRIDIPREFLRHFGRAMPRRRGVDWAWTDELAFCHAGRALRFERLPLDYHQWHANIRCAFRRLMSDGEAVTRLEVGLSYNRLGGDLNTWRHWDSTIATGDDPTQDVPDIDPLSLVDHIIKLSTHVPLRGRSKPRPLLLQGRDLAQLFATATSNKKVAEPWHQRVSSCPPIVLVECPARWLRQLPEGFARIASNKAGNIDLAFGRVASPWGPVGVWLLGHGKDRVEHVRSLRLCLLRLHAEQEVLDAVLDRIDNGGIKYEPGTPRGDTLETYLNKATRLINRNSWGGIDQSAILHAFDAAHASQYRGVRTNLATRLQGIQRQIKIKVERFEARPFPRSERHIHLHDDATYIETVETMTEQKTINIGAGATINAPVTIADNIENSFNNLEKGTASSELTELMQTLLKQITEAAEARPEETKQLAADAETLSKEVTSEKPRRKWYELSVEGIKEAAKALGEVGKPIIETTAKLLPLLVTLFP